MDNLGYTRTGSANWSVNNRLTQVERSDRRFPPLLCRAQCQERMRNQNTTNLAK